MRTAYKTIDGTKKKRLGEGNYGYWGNKTQDGRIIFCSLKRNMRKIIENKMAGTFLILQSWSDSAACGLLALPRVGFYP